MFICNEKSISAINLRMGRKKGIGKSHVNNMPSNDKKLSFNF